MRCTRRVFEDKLYTLGSLDGYRELAAADDELADSESTDNDLPADPMVEPRSKVARIVVPEVAQDLLAEIQVENDNVKPISEWLVHCMKIHLCFGLQCRSKRCRQQGRCFFEF